MKNRFFKFITMLLVVVSLGTAATMLNLKLHGDMIKMSPGLPDYGLMEAERMENASVSHFGNGNPIGDGQYPPNGEIQRADGVISQIGEKGSYDGAETDLRSPYAQEQTGVSDNGTYDVLTEAKMYYDRLADMNSKLQLKLQNVEGRSFGQQQDAMDTVLEFWDDELNAIYQQLRATMPENEFEVLRSEERAWLRDRDEAAAAAAARENQSNSAQNLAYTRSLVEWTRDRVYELAKLYYGE